MKSLGNLGSLAGFGFVRSAVINAIDAEHYTTSVFQLRDHDFVESHPPRRQWIQARTKGTAMIRHQAFYARTRLVKKIFEMVDASGAFTEKLAA